MEEKDTIVIKNKDGNSFEAELITFLISDDRTKTYIVYSKGEQVGSDLDNVIYISRVYKNDQGIMIIEEINDANEWSSVQQLLKKIANAA